MRQLAERKLKENERQNRLLRTKSNEPKRYHRLHKPVSDYVSLAFMTTGSRPGADRIIQIGATKYVNGKQEAQFNTLINPKRFIPIKVTKETGIANAFVENAPTIERKLEELLSFIDDQPILTNGVARQMAFFYALESELDVKLPTLEVIDANRVARKATPILNETQLEQLVETIDQESKSAHALERSELMHDMYEISVVNDISF